MRHWMWRVVVVVVCLLAAACQQGVLSDQDKAAIQKSHDEYAKMVTADKVDPAALAKMYYTDDAQVLPPNMPMVEGQAAIAQLYTALGQAKTFKFGPLTIEGSGGTAWVEGTYELTGPMPGTGEPVSEKGKFIEIWQKQSDESWKASRDMWSADTPPPGLAVAAGALRLDASAELKKLDWFAGKWAFEVEAKTASPLSPAGKSTLAMECRWSPGGSNLLCANDGITPVGPYHEVMIFTYDADTKGYRGFDSDNTGLASPFALVAGKDTWTFGYDLKVGGKTAKGRMTLYNLSNDGCQFKQEMSIGGGPFTPVAEGTGKKLPG